MSAARPPEGAQNRSPRAEDSERATMTPTRTRRNCAALPTWWR